MVVNTVAVRREGDGKVVAAGGSLFLARNCLSDPSYEVGFTVSATGRLYLVVDDHVYRAVRTQYTGLYKISNVSKATRTMVMEHVAEYIRQSTS